MPHAILDPTGTHDRPASATPAATMAPRPASLVGARIGLVENTKHNAALLLDELGRLIVESFPGARVTVQRTKVQFALPLPQDQLDDLLGSCDVVITGVGDCGSCSASAVTDGVLLERAGIPSAVICSDAFITTADAMRDLQGMPDYPYLTTPHPVAVLAEDQVRARARELLPAVVEVLTAGTSS